MNWQHAAHSVKDLVFRIAGDKYKTLVEIALLWEDLVGPLLAERSFVSHLEQRVLFIGVSNPTWLQELVLLKQPLLDKIHQQGISEVDDIIFFAKTKRGGRHSRRKVT
jgi:hypothetical protein